MFSMYYFMSENKKKNDVGKLSSGYRQGEDCERWQVWVDLFQESLSNN